MQVYEKQFESDVKNLKEIAKCFIENIKIKQKLFNQRKVKVKDKTFIH